MKPGVAPSVDRVYLKDLLNKADILHEVIDNFITVPQALKKLSSNEVLFDIAVHEVVGEVEKLASTVKDASLCPADGDVLSATKEEFKQIMTRVVEPPLEQLCNKLREIGEGSTGLK